MTATWKVEIGGRTFWEHDLSLDDAERVCEHVGQHSWRAAHPQGGPKHAKAIFACFLQKGTDLSFEQALEQAGQLGMGVLGSFEIVEDDRPTQHSAGVPLDPPKAEPGTG